MIFFHNWIRVSVFAICIFSLFLFYHFLTGFSLTLSTINSTVAYTGFFLIILSFASPNLVFYFPSTKRFTPFRKQCGLLGFYLIIVHASVVLLLLTREFPFPDLFLYGAYLYSFSAAVIAFTFFLMMALISNTYAMGKLQTHWRQLLRVGYAGILFALIHMVVRDKETLQFFLTHPASLPPLSLFMTWLGILAITLRILAFIRTKNQQKHIMQNTTHQSETK